MTVKRKTIGWMIILMLGVSSLSWADLMTFNVNESIPDADPTGLQNTQTLSGYDVSIESISVTLKISGDSLAFGGDFFVSLQNENGGYSVLLNRVGKTASDDLGYDMNGFDLTFSLGSNDVHLAENFSPTYDVDGLLTGTWGSDGRNEDPDTVLDTDLRDAQLDVFNGINPNGDWTLFVADMSQNGTAKLESWGMDIQAIPEPATMALIGLAGFGLLVGRRFMC